MIATTPLPRMDLSRVLVTGGCGFIGSNLVRLLLQGWPNLEVVNLDALTYAGNPHSLAHLAADPRYRFVHGRVEDSVCCRAALEGVEAVFHLAAETHVDRSILGPQVFVTTNVLGTQVLLEAAREAGVRRFLQVSTDEVYGPTPEPALFGEEAPFRPSSPYAATKAAAELLALAHGRTHGTEVLVTRCSNNYGPFQFPEKLVPLTIINALEGEPIPVYGDGQQVRDWIHVEDHCLALCTVLALGEAGMAYNIATGSRTHNLDLIQTLLDALDSPRDLIRHVTDRPGHDRRYALNAARIRALGWTPRRRLVDGLRETIDWYRGNRRWWEAVRDGSYRQYYDTLYGERLSDGEAEG